MQNEQFFKAALQELMQSDDGVNPNSPIPVQQQLEAKRAHYLAILELKPFKERIQKAVECICTDLHEESALILEISNAANILIEHPEKQGKELGLSQASLDTLFTTAEKKLQDGVFDQAASLCTLLTVLDASGFRSWFFLGVSLQELKAFNEAIDAYQKALEIAEFDPMPHVFIAECYVSCDDMQKAQFHLDKAKTILKGLEQNIELETLIKELEQKIKK